MSSLWMVELELSLFRCHHYLPRLRQRCARIGPTKYKGVHPFEFGKVWRQKLDRLDVARFKDLVHQVDVGRLDPYWLVVVVMVKVISKWS